MANSTAFPAGSWRLKSPPPDSAQAIQDALGEALRGRPAAADAWSPASGHELALLGAATGTLDTLDAGGAGSVAGMTLGARGPGPGTPAALVGAARRIATDARSGPALAKDGDYQPRTPGIAGDWRGRWKCNLLVADALWAAGFRVPTHDIGAPGAPRIHVEAPRFFYRHRDAFTPIGDRNALRPGDVVTVEYPAPSGESPASHCLIVSGVRRDAAGRIVEITTIEATYAGGRESAAWSATLIGARDRGERFTTTDGDTVRFLRPRR